MLGVDLTVHPAALLAHLGPDHLELLTTSLAATAAGAAAWSARRLEGRRRRERLLLAVGLGLVAVVLAPPVERLAERSLWGHMAQHLALTHVVAPLLALAAPAALLQRRLRGTGARRAVGGTVRRLRRLVGRPAGAVLAATPFVVVMVWWHVPVAYDAAVRNDLVHGIEHVSMLAAALVVWSVVHDSTHLGADHFPTGALVVLGVVMAVGVALGAALTFTPSLLYQPPPLAPPGWAGLADQRAAAALLWGTGGVVTVLAAVLTLGHWLQRQGEGDADAAARPVATGSLRR